MLGTIGEIRGFGGNFAPRTWAFCQGQLMSIAQNTAAFSILGTTYGGDGRTTFALPDLRGRIPMSSGTGPGLSPRPLGQRSGTEDETLNILQMPSHNHVVTPKYSNSPNVANPAGANPGDLGSGPSATFYSPNATGNMGQSSISHVGGGQDHTNMSPNLVLNWVVCLQGTYPSRS